MLEVRFRHSSSFRRAAAARRQLKAPSPVCTSAGEGHPQSRAPRGCFPSVPSGTVSHNWQAPAGVLAIQDREVAEPREGIGDEGDPYGVKVPSGAARPKRSCGALVVPY
jgi:hypothetical protein